jgi:KipI family sensor histidine kinase inhibitor
MPEIAPPRLVWQGEDCLCLRWTPAIDAELNAMVHRSHRAVQPLRTAGLLDCVPAYASLALYFDPMTQLDRATIEQEVREALALMPGESDAPSASPLVEVPVCYHPDSAPDLLDAAERLQLDPDDLISRHTAASYQVAMLGFAPGFPYLLGMDPTLSLPRHDQPRANVPAGSVGIAGAQTGIYPQASPGGWQLIGRTPWRLFDPYSEPAARLQPGQHVRFVAIDPDRFQQLSEHPA